MSIHRRPVLGALSLLPLAGAGAIALSSRGTRGLPELTRPEEAAEPGALRLYAEGPLRVPEEVLDASTSDEELGIVPPSPTIGLSAVALETDSSVLFGRATTSATLKDDQGNPYAPSIGTTPQEGEVRVAKKTTLGFGALGQIFPEIEGTASVLLTSQDGGRPIADAVQTTVTETGDFRSLSLSRLLTPQVDVSFLGMSTTTGSTSVLVLRNQTSRPATASVQIWTVDGPADMRGRSRIVVAPGSEERLLLDTVSPDQAAVGLRVVTVGAPLLMHVSTTERDGLTPRGGEILAPLPRAENEPVIPGVHVPDPASPPLLTLLNSSGSDVAADVVVVASSGEVALEDLTGIEVPAGTLVSVPLPVSDAGDYAVRVMADGAVDAVVRSTAPGADLPGDTLGTESDFAISAAAPLLSRGTVLALPALGPFGLLALVSDEETSATVIPVGADGGVGEPVEVEIPANTLVTVPAARITGTQGTPAGLAVSPGGVGGLHAVWVQVEHRAELAPLLSTETVRPPQREAESLSVRIR